MTIVNGYEALMSDWYLKLEKQIDQFPVATADYHDFILKIVDNEQFAKESRDPSEVIDRSFSVELSTYGRYPKLFPVFFNAVTRTEEFRKEIGLLCTTIQKSYEDTRFVPTADDEKKAREAKREENHQAIKKTLVRILLLNAKTIIEETFKRHQRDKQLDFILKQSTENTAVDDAILNFSYFYFGEEVVRKIDLDNIRNLQARVTKIQQVDGATLCQQCKLRKVLDLQCEPPA